MSAASTTAERLIDAAERLVQTRGYNGFSYADLSEAVGIRKASIHHHFPAKGDLGRVVAERYRASFRAALDRIDDDGGEPADRLTAYAALYAKALSEKGRMCLCGMLAAEYSTLPAPVQSEVRGFFDDQRTWLTETLSGQARPRAQARRAGEALLAGLEGALLVSRVDDDHAGFARTAQALVRAFA